MIHSERMVHLCATVVILDTLAYEEFGILAHSGNHIVHECYSSEDSPVALRLQKKGHGTYVVKRRSTVKDKRTNPLRSSPRRRSSGDIKALGVLRNEVLDLFLGRCIAKEEKP
jgi:hypothetical protein